MPTSWLDVDGDAVYRGIGQQGLQYAEDQSANLQRATARNDSTPGALGSSRACLASMQSGELIGEGSTRNINRAHVIGETGQKIGSDTNNTLDVVTQTLTIGDMTA